MTPHVCEILQLLSATAIGLLIGALLAEGALLVPHWRSLPRDEFHNLHANFGPRLFGFYAPLTTAAVLLSWGTALATARIGHSGWCFSLLSAALMGGLLGIYFLYFKRANGHFARGDLSAPALELELARWAGWHWTRVWVGLIAFVASLLALRY